MIAQLGEYIGFKDPFISLLVKMFKVWYVALMNSLYSFYRHTVVSGRVV